MKENKRTPGNKAAIIAEYRLLNALVKRPELSSDGRISSDVFVDELAKSIYEAIEELRNRNIEITEASLMQAGNNIDLNVNESVIKSVFDIDKEGASSIEDILSSLNNAKIKLEILNRAESLKSLATSSGDIDVSKANELLYEAQDILEQNTTTESPLMSMEEWRNMYIEDLDTRRNGGRYEYHDPLLDKVFFKGAYPGAITIIAGTAGMGKSSYAMYLANGFLQYNVPTCYFSLEMSAIDQYDRLLSSRCCIPNSELYKPENIDSMIEAINSDATELGDRNNFYFCEKPTLSVSDIRSLVREFKKKTRSEYAVIIIDLITQLRDFMSSNNSTTTAASAEIAMNALNALAKSENIHIIGLAQFRRASEQIKINKEEDIDLLRPTLTDIKNSGALGERARHVMSVFRKQYYKEKYLLTKNEDGTVDKGEFGTDILDVQVLKNSNGETGNIIHYNFDSSCFRITPILTKEDIEESNGLSAAAKRIFDSEDFNNIVY